MFIDRTAKIFARRRCAPPSPGASTRPERAGAPIIDCHIVASTQQAAAARRRHAARPCTARCWFSVRLQQRLAAQLHVCTIVLSIIKRCKNQDEDKPAVQQGKAFKGHHRGSPFSSISLFISGSRLAAASVQRSARAAFQQIASASDQPACRAASKALS